MVTLRPVPVIAFILALALLAGLPGAAQSQSAAAPEAEAQRAAMVATALASGDGRSDATAYRVERAIDSHHVVLHLQLRLVRQRSLAEGATMLDIWTVRAADGGEREVFFRVPAPDTLAPEQAESDAAIRRILTSGDGRSPETAFVSGGVIGAQYAILRLMGYRRNVQALIDRGGCYYDVQRALDEATGETQDVWFRLGGGGALRYTGRCEQAR